MRHAIRQSPRSAAEWFRPQPLPRGRPEPRPFLKWAGGKSQLLPRIESLLPARIRRYFEPFVGGGALFFALRPPRAVLSDCNRELINCYRVVRDRAEDLICALGEHRIDERHYYRARDLDPDLLSPVERAARTIYLNRAGFNGLYRVNGDGKFNVPFGANAGAILCDAGNLRACSNALRGAELRTCDFGEATRAARAGDFVYFDPPYAPASRSSYFTAYTPGGFGWQDQERVAAVFAQLARSGVNMMLSSPDMPAVRALYRGFAAYRLRARRLINAQGGRRGPVGEILVLSGEAIEMRPGQPRALLAQVRRRLAEGERAHAALLEIADVIGGLSLR